MTQMHKATDVTTPRRKPQRTCVGCRTVDAQDALMRAVLDAAGQVSLQRGARRAPGRGAYVHAREACLRAASRGGFARSFRQKVGGAAPGQAIQAIQAQAQALDAATPKRGGLRSLTEKNPVGNWDQDNNS